MGKSKSKRSSLPLPLHGRRKEEREVLFLSPLSPKENRERKEGGKGESEKERGPRSLVLLFTRDESRERGLLPLSSHSSQEKSEHVMIQLGVCKSFALVRFPCSVCPLR